MSGEFKFKYLDAGYIKLLQQNANKKLHEGRNEDEIETIRKSSNKSDKSIALKNGSERCENGQREKSVKSPELIIETMKFTNKVTTLSQYIDVASPRSKSSYNESPKATETLKEPKTKLQALSPQQTHFEENESILSKITSSQRTSCTVIDSLLPNIIEKPIFDTPMEAERCRRRFEAFIRMFTRNYSYPIELMLTDIQSSRSYSPASLTFKINSLYKILQVALSAYTTNVRNYLDNDIPPKIVELLNSIQQSTLICIERMLFDEDDYIVQFVLGKVNDVLMDLESIRHGKSDYISKAKNIKMTATRKQTNRLCMYGSPSNQMKAAQKRSVQLKLTKKNKELMRTAQLNFSLSALDREFKEFLTDHIKPQQSIKCENNHEIKS